MERAHYVEAPEVYAGDLISVFLAGGISGCPNWQAEVYQRIADLPVAVFNPRRAGFPMDDPSAAAGQIGWEFQHLRRADVVTFWFPDSGPITQPVALYELGAHAADRGKRIVVGVEPGYVRETDVVLQLRHVRPGLPVCHSLAELVDRTRDLLHRATG